MNTYKIPEIILYGNVKDIRYPAFCTFHLYFESEKEFGQGDNSEFLIGNCNYGINSHSVDLVYNRLLRNLPYNETKKYLKNITERTKIYEGWM